MCGIVGFSSNNKNNFDQSKLSLLMIWNYKERGGDATGIFSPSIGVIKSTDKASDFLKKTPLRTIEDSVFIGHVRSGTSGDKTKVENAHPFEFENLVGVHNGTVFPVFKLFIAEGYETSPEYTVDSKIIYKLINDKGVDIIKKIDGALSLVWYDKNTKELKVYRNKERELYYGEIKTEVYDEKSIYISSIKDSLEIIGCTDIKEFESEYLYTIKDGKVDDTTINIPRFKEPTIIDKFSKYINCIGRFKKTDYANNFWYTTPTFYKKFENCIPSDIDSSITNVRHHNFFKLLSFHSGINNLNIYAKVELFINGLSIGERYFISSSLEDLYFLNSKSYKDRFIGVVAIKDLFDTTGEKVLSSLDFTILKNYEKNEITFESTIPEKKNIDYTIDDPTVFLPIYSKDDLDEFNKLYNVQDLSELNNETDKNSKSDYISFHIDDFKNLQLEISKIVKQDALEIYRSTVVKQVQDMLDEKDLTISGIFDEFQATCCLFDGDFEEEFEEESEEKAEEVEISENLNTE